MPNLLRNFWSKLGFPSSTVAFLLCGMSIQMVQADEKPSTLAIKDTSKFAENDAGFKTGSFILAPIPIKSPSIGTGLALAGSYLFKFDKESDTSFIGVTGFRTDNGSKGYGLAGAFSWNENKWKVSALAGDVDVVYDFYIPKTGGRTVSLEQSGKLLNLEGSYGVTEHFNLGFNLRYLETTIQFATPILTPAQDTNLEIISFGPTINWDYRDDSIYPTSGFYVGIDSLHSIVLNGLDREYHKTVLKYNNYFSVFERSVIATRFAACRASDSTPFFELCSLGGTDNFRGFPFGELLDQNLLSGQIEFRGRMGKRFGYVAFAGIGGVASDFGAFNSDTISSAGGVGLRYRLSKKTPLDFAFDVAVNSNGETTSYITIGQRF
jgi:outer membrane protein assembly factor BamA